MPAIEDTLILGLRRHLARSAIALKLLCIVLIAGGHAVGAESRTDQLEYAVYLGGVRIGKIKMIAESSDKEFKIDASIATSGLASVLSGFQHRSQVRGTVRKGEFRQRAYISVTKTRKRKSEVGIVYSGDRPNLKYYRPEREPSDHDLVPSEQTGTLNPTITAYFMLRDATDETLCDQTYEVFDGRRRTRLSIGAAEFKDDEVICDALFARVAGYSPEALDERSGFETRLFYRPAGNGTYRLRKITAETTIGKVNVLRN